MPTTIQIKENTLKRLKEHKFTQRQSYDEVINRVLNEVEEETLSTEEIEDLQEALEQVKNGQLHKIEDVAKELGIQL
jgi:predicted transcriptional regulator